MENGRTSDDLDLDFSANLISVNSIDLKEMRPNNLSPRQQERADEPLLRAVRHLFNNRFMKAKALFEKYAQFEPLHALGLGSMAFLKAVMTSDDQATKNAINVLTTTYNLANAQIDAATKKNVGDSVVSYVTGYYQHIKYSRGSKGSGLPSSPKPVTKRSIQEEGVDFLPNGVLRAHVAKAECCLQMAILQLLQENVMNYIKCGLNLRRAYVSYSLVWQEYKRMGQEYNDFIDKDTVSGIQFGIGTVHLILASLPQKILRVVSAFGWKADKHLGFALLKLCLEDRRIRSPMASLMLLAYYTVLTSLCPQVLANEYTQPAIETLLDAQRTYPNSAFFLYFAGRTSRLARNLTLSTQSFMYGIEISKNEWAEVEVLHMCSYEIGFNYMMQHEWEEAAKIFEMLYKERYWSPAIFRYLQGACLDMFGQRTEAILAFAEVPDLVGSKSSSTAMMENYVLRKVKTLQSSGYQDMDMTVCALEYLCLYNAFDFMEQGQLQKCLDAVDQAQLHIVEAEKIEFGIRTRELLPQTPAPQYYDQRGAVLLIKSSIQNAMGCYRDSIIHLNWIIDHKDNIKTDRWIVPFAYWEAGVVSWGIGNKKRSNTFWETALKYSKYDFEYRLATRINLAMTKAQEQGGTKPVNNDNDDEEDLDMQSEHSVPLNDDSEKANDGNQSTVDKESRSSTPTHHEEKETTASFTVDENVSQHQQKEKDEKQEKENKEQGDSHTKGQ
ncbi:uncharacterized protein BX664DRAFT_91006 [Halteromyces radiatus]|uniref:uncharacterized protein n=1 Tax=Halteromyces radiatus TaxID=101107 RepID=UPI0022209268|nr:uncharacterized protein BX664DRAFT_91006 [Halteromyces radiatus]KAI8092618.1 hypothetical protein BX664DRAFT_91006 [Halteromyces radiatus]